MVEERARPLLRVWDGLLGAAELERLREAVSLERLGATVERGRGGAVAPLAVESDPALGALRERLLQLVGLPEGANVMLEVRHAGRGDFHPVQPAAPAAPAVGDVGQIATAIVYLSACEGGGTRLPGAEPSLTIAPQAGRVAVWLTIDGQGAPEPAAGHALAPVRGGERVAIVASVYATPEQVRVAAGEAAGAEGTSAPLLARLQAEALESGERPTLTVITEYSLPETTLESLRRAAAAAGIGYREVLASTLDPRVPPLEPGAMLFRPATSHLAMRAERQLWRPGVATVHGTPAGPYALHIEQWNAFSRAGLPTPRTLRLDRADPDFLDDAVAWLGGFPIIVRVDSGEGGDGVLLAESMASLRGLADLFTSRGLGGRLAAFIPDAMHWRLIVVGDRIVTAYTNPTRPDDFRSEPAGDPAHYGLTPSPEMADLAIRAATISGTRFAGVDVLAHPSGRLYVLEANFPCYFPQGESYGAADVSGALLAFLLQQRSAAVE